MKAQLYDLGHTDQKDQSLGLVEPCPRPGYTRPMSIGSSKIAFVGAGNMAEALIAGLLKAKLTEPAHIWATDVSKTRLESVETRFKVQVSTNNLEAAQWADFIVLAVKPQVMDEVLVGIKNAASPSRLFITVAAGYPMARLRSHLGSKISVIRAMPNTPSVVLEGATALSPGTGVSTEQIETAKAMFEAVGKVVVTEERLLDAVTGLSGSGPAYVYLMIEALADGGVRMGLPRQAAQLLATQTVFGTAKMILETGDHPGVLKDRVTSPGGTTIAGLHKLEQGGLRATLMNAVEAATHRSRELGE